MRGIESRTLNLPGKCPTSKLPSLCNVAIRKLKSIFIYLLMRVERHTVAYSWRKRTSCVNRFSPSIVWTPGIHRLGGRSLSYLSPLACRLELGCMAPVSYLSYIRSPRVLDPPVHHPHSDFSENWICLMALTLETEWWESKHSSGNY